MAVRLVGESGTGYGRAGQAMRILFTLEGHYVECPHALTFYTVPKKVLISLGAVFAGVVAGVSATYLHPLLGGGIGGLGSLFLNILAKHYSSKAVRGRSNPASEGRLKTSHFE
jgi:hypothetical protein